MTSRLIMQGTSQVWVTLTQVTQVGQVIQVGQVGGRRNLK